MGLFVRYPRCRKGLPGVPLCIAIAVDTTSEVGLGSSTQNQNTNSTVFRGLLIISSKRTLDHRIMNVHRLIIMNVVSIVCVMRMVGIVDVNDLRNGKGSIVHLRGHVLHWRVTLLSILLDRPPIEIVFFSKKRQ